MSLKRKASQGLAEHQQKVVRTVSALSEPSVVDRLLSISNFKPEEIPYGELINGRYSIEKFLAKGGFAKVIVAIDQVTKQRVAIKIGTAKQPVIIQLMRREMNALRKLDHKNIIKVYDLHQDAKLCCIMMEYVEGGELLDRITKENRCYTENRAHFLAKTLLSTIAYMHQKQVIHRDLKPDNLVMVSHSCDSDVKIIDFGLSAVSLQECQGKVGTAYYMAPEILKGENYDEKIDIWSLGVILYLLLFGVLPFSGRTREELNRSILEKDVVFPENSPVSSEARKFLRELLIKNPCERLSATQALGSNWIYQSVVSSSAELSETKKNLRRFQAKRKLRKFLYVILAVVIWRRICKHRHVSQIPFINNMEIIEDDDPIHSTSEGF